MIKEKEFTAQIEPGLLRSLMESALVDQDIDLDNVRGVAIEASECKEASTYNFLVRYQDTPKPDPEDDLEEELGPRQEDCDAETCESCQ